MKAENFELELIDAMMIAPRVRHFVWRRVDGQPFTFIPGQFINIHLTHDDKIIRRSYSAATMDQSSGLIEMAASYVEGGFATQFLSQAEKGTRTPASGPYGRLILRDEPLVKHIVLIATGTGITPYRAMLPALQARLREQENLQVTIILGGRNRGEALYVQDFLRYMQDTPRLQFLVCYSREHDIQLQAHERLGRTNVALDALSLNPETDVVYLCGNPNMIDETFAQLQAQGFAMQQVRREKYISS